MKILFARSSYSGRTMDALVLEAEEGRGKPRNCPGEVQATFDPGVPELGNHTSVTGRQPLSEHIGLGRVSGRTETSQ